MSLPFPRLSANGLSVITANGLKSRVDADKDWIKVIVESRNPEDRRKVWEYILRELFTLRGPKAAQYDEFRAQMGLTLEQVYRIAAAYVTPIIGDEIGR